jgi:hypothetical protein
MQIACQNFTYVISMGYKKRAVFQLRGGPQIITADEACTALSAREKGTGYAGRAEAYPAAEMEAGSMPRRRIFC